MRASQAIPPPENQRHYAGLDGLRAVAVLMVFTQHYFVYPESYRWGWTGVQVFFVLSGFLITGILYDTREAPNRYRTFYARRALRIFPLYFAVLAMGWVLWPIFRWELHPAWLLAPVYLSNYSRFVWLHDFLGQRGVEHLLSSLPRRYGFWLYYGHFWSLAVEEQFYLLWPFVVFTLRDRRRLLTLCLAAVCLTPLLRLLCTLTLPHALLQAAFVARVTPLQCDSLLLGAALALWLRGEHPKLTTAARIVLAAMLLGFAVFAYSYHAVHRVGYVPDYADPVFGSIGISAINLCSAAVLLLAIDSSTLWSRFLHLRFLRWLGTISYGFYVFHDIPHLIYDSVATTFAGVVRNKYGVYTGVLALLMTLLLAALSFELFETPFLRLKSRFVAETSK